MSLPAADTTMHVTSNRDGAHYACDVPDELTPEQQRAVDAVREAEDARDQAERALRAATTARIRAVQQYKRVLGPRGMGWRPAARAIGNISESTLRNDSTRAIEEEN